jgi:aminoglycoside phosphotransferase (APT) family kinase protein
VPVNDGRIFPLLPVSRGDLEAVVDSPIVRFEALEGGFTNTLHKVVLGNGTTVVVKHYAGGRKAFTDEVATLTRLAGILPVPEIVRTDPKRKAAVYRWIEGTTLDDCRATEPPAAFASLADPLGRLFAWVARTEPLDPNDRYDVVPLLAQARKLLDGGRARERMGTPLAKALLAAFDARAERMTWGPQCLCHHDIGGRNVLVQRAEGDRWRIQGVIDWESAGTGSPLVDVGSLFRYAPRYDETFRLEFERGYREAGGELPDDWYRTSRTLDAFRMIDTLDGIRELPGVFADCRMLLAKLAADLAA